MQTQIETLDAATSTMTLSLDIGLYPRDVLYAAAYVFLDRAYVLLDRDGARFLVHLRGKQAARRGDAARHGGRVRERAARAGAAPPGREGEPEDHRGHHHAWPSPAPPAGPAPAATPRTTPLIDMENPADDGFLDDPLGIATPWEAKKKDAE